MKTVKEMDAMMEQMTSYRQVYSCFTMPEEEVKLEIIHSPSLTRRYTLNRWGKYAAWIVGDGGFGVFAWCRILTITLWNTLEEAERSKGLIDATGCGGDCSREHEVYHLRIPRYPAD